MAVCELDTVAFSFCLFLLNSNRLTRVTRFLSLVFLLGTVCRYLQLLQLFPSLVTNLSTLKMDTQPPNDPNRNNNNHNHNAKHSKSIGTNNDNPNDAPMDIMGDLNEAPVVVVMFVLGVVAWLLREQCVC